MITRAAGLALYGGDRTERPAPAAPPRSVRLSLTDRCDLACVYCRPSRADGYLADRLDEDAWKRMVAGLLRAGVRRVRLTGGEPLLYARVVEMVEHLASLPIDDLALTTNGTRLPELAARLRTAGLRRITISLDSLDPARFARITRGGDHARVMAGIHAALAAGFDEVKINCVVLRGENDDELVDMTRWAWSLGIVPRFIELMAIGEGAKLIDDKLVTAREMRARLSNWVEPGDGAQDPDRGPACYVQARANPHLRVGFITGTSDTFCDRCDRLRVAADGELRPCLATETSVGARELAMKGDVDGIADAVAAAWRQKPDGRLWKGCTEESAARVSMRAIGG